MSSPLIAPKQFPVNLDREWMEKALDGRYTQGAHESVVRSYHVLALVKDLLQKKVNHDVILQIIELNYDEQS
jgi:hypothetical protein